MSTEQDRTEQQACHNGHLGPHSQLSRTVSGTIQENSPRARSCRTQIFPHPWRWVALQLQQGLSEYQRVLTTKYHSVQYICPDCPPVGIGILPCSLSPASVSLPVVPMGGHTRLRVRCWGSPNSDD